MIFKIVNLSAVSGGAGSITNDDANWDNCKGATAGDSASTGNPRCRSERQAGGYQIIRGLCPINSASIPAYAYILSATLKLYCNSKTKNLTNGETKITAPTSQASTSGIVVGDFDQCGNAEVGGLGASQINLNAYNNFPISNPNTIVQKGAGAVTKFGLREYYDFASFPESNNFNHFEFDGPAGSNPPILEVKYALYGTPSQQPIG